MSSMMDGVDRREALRLLGLAAAAAMEACSPPDDQGPRYVSDPFDMGDPGAVTRYATTLTLGGFGRGVLVLVRDNRPVKIEGNPHHPASLGGTDVFCEAAVLDLFDPQRSQAPLGPSGPMTWEALAAALTRALAQTPDGEGVSLLTGRVTSPTSLRQIALIQAKYPRLKWVRYEPINDDAASAGSAELFGEARSVRYDFEAADIVVALDADFLGPGPSQIVNARSFAASRTRANPSRLYVLEPCLTATGACADHRLALTPDDIAAAAFSLAAMLGTRTAPPAPESPLGRNLSRIAHALRAAGARALVLPGPRQSAAVHRACASINRSLGTEMQSTAASDPHPETSHTAIAGLVAGMMAGRVRTLIMLGCNPVYSAPGALHFANALARVPAVFHFGAYRDESAALAHHHGPLSHELECWGDARSVSGETSLIQPIIRPLFETRTPNQVLALITDEPADNARGLVETTWQALWGDDFAKRWRDGLARGVVASDAATSVGAAQPLPAPAAAAPPRARAAWVLVFNPSPQVWDGDRAPNTWLQECPDPISKEAWGASLRMNAEDARRLGLSDGDVVALRAGDAEVEAPICVEPGQCAGVLAAQLGYGRSHSGPVADGVGFDAYRLLPADGALSVGVELRKTGKRHLIPTTQNMFALEGASDELYPVLRPGQRAPRAEPKPSLIAPPAHGARAWAMVVDNAACIGCNACVLACQAENNLAIIGAEEMLHERDMHWLRIDRFNADSQSSGGFQPTPCMHCEQAPCEPVCPVAASVHDSEGLNLQVYNRCVGTRFCQANCPYKVRHFNYDDYSLPKVYGALDESAVTAVRNPEVTVRNRGVMEKCTYCVQRIAAARHEANVTDRPIADGEVVTACQAACPAKAIHFGDKADHESEVAHIQDHARRHVLLEHIGTRPRTTHLARVWNADEDWEE